MGRKIGGVIVGYIVMAAFIFLSFTLLYLILGTEGSFKPASYQVSAVWLIASLILGLIAAVIGGYVCVMIAKEQKTAYILAGIVLVLGILFALPGLSVSDEEMNKVREGNVPNMEAMQNAKQPPLVLILNPIIGAVGVILGSRMKKTKASEFNEQTV